MHQLRLVIHKGQHPTHVVGNAQRQQSNDQDQQQDPPETQVFHKLLPRGSEAGQDAFALLEVGVEQRMAFHGTFALCRLHGLQLRVRASVKSLYFLFFQRLQQSDDIFVHTPALCQN